VGRLHCLGNRFQRKPTNTSSVSAQEPDNYQIVENEFVKACKNSSCTVGPAMINLGKLCKIRRKSVVCAEHVRCRGRHVANALLYFKFGIVYDCDAGVANSHLSKDLVSCAVPPLFQFDISNSAYPYPFSSSSAQTVDKFVTAQFNRTRVTRVLSINT